MHRALVPLLLLLAGGGLAYAEEPGDALEASTRAVLVAWEAQDGPALQALAARNDPDPWLLADALVARGEAAAAAGLATASPRPDTRRLEAYVERRRTEPTPAAWRAGLAASAPLLEREAWQEAHDLLAALKATPEYVAGVRVTFRRGVALVGLQREVEAGALFEQLAEEARALGWLAMSVRALSRAGLCHVSARRWSRAVTVLDKLIVLESQRANESGVAVAYIRLGFAQEGQGDPVRAFESVHRSREAAARAGDRAGEARAWSSLGRLYHVHARDPAKAVAALEKAVTALEGVDDKSRLAHTLIELGMALRRTGQLERAAAAHDRAYKLLDAMRDKPGMAVALSGLGGLCIRRGEYARALTCLEEARLLMQALGNPKGEAAVLAQLGELYTLLSDAERAERCFASSFSIAEEMGAQRPLSGPAERSGEEATPPESDGSHAQLLERALSCVPNGCDGDACASILRRLGSLHMLEGEFGTTLGRHEAALEAAERTGDPLQVTAALVDLAGMHRAMGTLKGALEVDQRAVELAQATGSYEALARALWSRATTRLQLGEPSGAVQDARRAVREATFVYTKLSEFDGARVGDLWRGLFETGVEAAMRLGSVSDAAWFLEAGRSGMLLTSLGGREALWSHVVPPALRREEALARAAESAALAGYRKAYAQRRLVEMRARRRELQDARTQVARVLARTRTEARGAANLVCPAPDTLATLQSRLARDEALVLYAVLPRRVLALVATPTEARIVKLGFRRGLERKLAGLDFASPDADTRGAVAALRAQLVGPLELPAAVRRVLVSPMGGLGLVPPALLFPKHEIAYVPSGTTYGLLLEERSLRGRGVLAVGDPDYSGLRRWAPLPGTRAEVEAVGTVRLLGRDANEPGFVRALGLRPRWRAVHLACHGVARADRPMASALALTPVEGSDGMLTSLELLDLRVPADLVVLSACDTARGEVYDVEGVVGLTRAFMFAGSPRVLASLWKVDDEATRALMTRFYELWNPSARGEGLGAGAALRQAQAWLRGHERWAHPYYWAAWVLWGLPE